MFCYVVAALVHGSGDERIAENGCSDRTIRRRVREWADAGSAETLFALAVAAYDKMIGLDLSNIAVDASITKEPCGGEAACPSPVDRRKQGLKRSTATDAAGVPLHVVCAGAHRHDVPLLKPTLGARSTGSIHHQTRRCIRAADTPVPPVAPCWRIGARQSTSPVAASLPRSRQAIVGLSSAPMRG